MGEETTRRGKEGGNNLGPGGRTGGSQQVQVHLSLQLAGYGALQYRVQKHAFAAVSIEFNVGGHLRLFGKEIVLPIGRQVHVKSPPAHLGGCALLLAGNGIRLGMEGIVTVCCGRSEYRTGSHGLEGLAGRDAAGKGELGGQMLCQVGIEGKRPHVVTGFVVRNHFLREIVEDTENAGIPVVQAKPVVVGPGHDTGEVEHQGPVSLVGNHLVYLPAFVGSVSLGEIGGRKMFPVPGQGYRYGADFRPTVDVHILGDQHNFPGRCPVCFKLFVHRLIALVGAGLQDGPLGNIQGNRSAPKEFQDHFGLALLVQGTVSLYRDDGNRVSQGFFTELDSQNPAGEVTGLKERGFSQSLELEFGHIVFIFYVETVVIFGRVQRLFLRAGSHNQGNGRHKDIFCFHNYLNTNL